VDRPPLTVKAIFLKNLVGPWGGRTTPRATVWPWGGFGHPRLAGMGGRNHPQGQAVALGGGLTTPRVILKNKKVLFYYLFFLILNNILLFFNK
jgi:hypothetical protein